MSLNELFKTLSDETRIRLLLLLDEQELTVAELAAITRLAQPRVSTHLAQLKKLKLVLVRKEGVCNYHRINREHLESEYTGFWPLLQSSYAEQPLAQQDRKRLQQVLQEQAASNNWFDQVAGDMERHYSPGRTWETTARALSRLVRLGDVLDIGSGDGVLAELLADQCHQYTCLDCSERIIDAARQRLAAHQNIRYEVSDMHALPFADNAFDQVLLLHTLTYSEQPGLALQEAHRVCKPGGKLLLSTLLKHAHESVVHEYGHVNLGFDIERLHRLCREAGFSQCHAEVVSQEQKKPHFKILRAVAVK